MIVCSCNVLSDGQVRACLNPGADCPRTAAQVYQCLGCSPKCGRCARTIRSIVAQALGEPHACSSSCAVMCPVADAMNAREQKVRELTMAHDHGHEHAHEHVHEHAHEHAHDDDVLAGA